MNNAVIYARYSAGPRQTDQSIEGQIADCQRYAEAHDLFVSKIYADKHVSGKSTEGRDEFLQMIADAKRKQFTDVIVWKVDRFGRDKTDIAIFKRELRKAGVKLHYAAESVPEGPEGIILESLLEGLAEYYSADLRQKVERGMRESLKKNQWPGKCPFGYTKDKQKNVIVVPEEAEIVRTIFRLYSEGHSIAKIERILANKGIYIKNGQIHHILRNPHYLGKFEMMGMEINVEPIITQEMWDMSQDKNRSAMKPTSKINYLLTGKLICSECGSILTGSHGTSKSGKKFAYYVCKNKCIKPLPKERYEMMILENVREIALTDEHITQIADRIMEIQNESLPNAEIKHIQAQIGDFERKVNNLYSAVEDGLKFDSVKDRISDYEQKISDLKIELAKLQISKPIIPREYLIKWLESFRSGDIASDDFCHRIVQTFIEKVVVYPDHSVIILNISGEKENPQCSNLESFVNLTNHYSNTGEILVSLPYALLWVDLKNI